MSREEGRKWRGAAPQWGVSPSLGFSSAGSGLASFFGFFFSGGFPFAGTISWPVFPSSSAWTAGAGVSGVLAAATLGSGAGKGAGLASATGWGLASTAGRTADGCPCGALAWESVPDGLAMMAVLMGFPLNAAGFLATAETAAGPLV